MKRCELRAIAGRVGAISCGLVLLVLTAGQVRAQSSNWDSLLSDSQWYVPAENLLAYMTSGTSLANPKAVADQTIWSLGTAVDGVFTGTSNATFRLVPTEVTFSSTTSMNGVVTTEGQVRIVFTNPDAPATIGIGQVREIDGVSLLEMQMMTGDDGVYITHWAYMASYDGGTLPTLDISPSQLRSEEWEWMAGTNWSLQNDELFGEGGTGFFNVSSYHNGYYWGTGTGPTGSATETFSLLGSATPEGNILFNVLSGETLTSLTGLVTGDATNGTMALRSYSTGGTFGAPGLASVVPEPGTVSLVVLAAGVVLLVSRRKRV